MVRIYKKSAQKPIAIDCNPFPEIYDPFGYGQRAVDFLRSLKHPKSRLRGQAFQLDAWQEKIVRQIYGPCHPDGRRIVRNALILIGRGNRKTSLGAALTLLHTMGPEAVPGGEVLTAASDRAQAKIAFKEAEGIIQSSADMWRKGQANRRYDAAGHIKLQEYKNRIQFPNGSFLEAVSSDAARSHGRTPVFALCDEIHVWPKRDLWDAITTGLTKVPGSLRITITTAGRGHENLAAEAVQYARDVASGKVDNPSFLPILFENPSDADWTDEAVWAVANPGLAYGYPDIEGLREMAREAKHRPGELAAFKQFHLNVWADHSATPFVEMAMYDKGADPVDLDALEHAPCWLGVDVSSNSDLTAVVAAWRDGDGGYIVHPWFFMPEDGIDKRTQVSGYPYDVWADQGLIIPTPGNVIDIRMVEDHIRDLCERYEVREIACDPHYAKIMLANLVEDGYPAIQFRQGWASMGPAIHELEKAILAGRFQHGAHPVLRWNFDNIAIQDDGKGNRSFNKSKARDKIDGAVACAMAVARAATGEDTRSIYDTDERPGGLLIF